MGKMMTVSRCVYIVVLSMHLVSYVTSSVLQPDTVTVELPDGGVVSGKVETFSSRYLPGTAEVNVFLGIPYAEPPVGERRFQPAEPIGSWTGVHRATEIPPVCMQETTGSFLEATHVGTTVSEDCLYLNVFAPRKLSPNAAVMVWIHGGALLVGSGLNLPTNPVVLSAFTDVIVVTLNYRLNIFGFFSTGDAEMPSNLGITDQQLALKWVSQNIAAFGGDPNKVTIFGESSGALSVGWHVLSEESRNYFQRAILQSGSPRDDALLTLEEAGDRAKLVASTFQCDRGDDVGTNERLLDCLRQIPATELLDSVAEIAEQTGQFSPFIGVEDGTFFPVSVAELIARGDYREIDMLLGTTKHEGFVFSYVLSGSSRDKPFFPKALFSAITSGSSTNPLVAELIDVIYASNVQDDANYVDALSDSLGDTAFVCSMADFARQVETAGSNVYMYHMTHEPANSLYNVSWSRAGHYEDLQFVFGWAYQPTAPSDVPYVEVKIATYVMRLWTNFAKTGNPNLSGGRRSGLPKRFPVWPQFTADEEQYKEISIKFANNRKLRQKFCNFWDKTLPKIEELTATEVKN